MAFKKPEKLISGVKILIFGEAGTYKSRTALSFPRTAYIDTDQGATHYIEEFGNNIAMYSDSTTFAEVMDDLNEVEDMLDDVDTIVLDSDTKVYENQQHSALRVAEQRARKNKRLTEGEGLSPKEWGVIKLNHEKMLSKLFEFKKEGKTIIVIAEAKDEKEAITDNNGNVSWKTIGLTPNSQKGIEFDFDVVLEMVKDPKTDQFLGAKVVKDRLGVIPTGELIENPTYDIWADKIEGMRKSGKKQERRNFEDDIAKDAESFQITKEVTSDKLIAQIDAEVDKLTDENKSAVGKDIKKILVTTANYRKATDTEKLQECLKVVTEAVAKQ